MSAKILDWDRLESQGRIRGPVIVDRNQVVVDPSQIRERDVKHYLSLPSTQDWYFEPIPCVRLENGRFEPNGIYAHSMVEACWRLGYKTLQICYVDLNQASKGART